MIEDLVEQMETRFAELGAQLTDPEVISDRERYAEVGRAYSQLEPAAKLAAQWRRAQDDGKCIAVQVFRQKPCDHVGGGRGHLRRFDDGAIPASIDIHSVRIFICATPCARRRKSRR